MKNPRNHNVLWGVPAVIVLIAVVAVWLLASPNLAPALVYEIGISRFRLIIEFIALTWGSGYLWFKHRERVRRWTSTDDPEKRIGHGINASELKPRVEHVRRDYLAARQVARGVWSHRVLLGFARRAVTQFGYFRHREPEEHAHDHGP